MVGRRVYDLNVASIIGKTIKGQTYYYLREVARVGGKPKVISQRYLGKAADIEAAVEGATVVPDRTRHLAFGDVAAVVFERELAFERVVDRLDPLPDPAELPEPRLLVASIGPQEAGIEGGDGALELCAGEPLVTNDDLAAVEQPPLAGALQHRCGDLTFGIVRWCQAEADRHPVGRAEQV